MRVLLLIIAGGMMLPVETSVAHAQGAPSVYLPGDDGRPYERPAVNPLEIVDRSTRTATTARNGVTPIPTPPQSDWDPQPTPSPSYPTERRSPNATYFTLPRGGSDAVAAGEGCEKPVLSSNKPSPLVPRDPPGGRVKSKVMPKVSGIGHSPARQYPQPEYSDASHLEPAPPTRSDRTLPQQPARIDSPPSRPLVSEPSLTPAPSAGGGSIPPARSENGVAPAGYQQNAEAASRSAESAGTVQGRALTSTSADSGSVPLGPADDKPSVALASPDRETASRDGRFGTLDSALTMISGLGIVLAIFLLVAWGLRRANPKAMGVLPQQVVEVLGRAPLAGRQQVYMIRCGAKLVLVSVTPDGAEPLTEITDPFEVDRLAGLCEQSRPTSSTATFRRVLNQYAQHGETADVG